MTLGTETHFTNQLLGCCEAYRNGQVRRWTQLGTQAEGKFGAAVGAAGDWNRDHRADVLVTLTSYHQLGLGRVMLYTGRTDGLALALATTLTGLPQRAAFFGSSVASAGDVNGDGVPDILIGAERATGERGAGVGQAYLYLSPAALARLKPDWTVQGTKPTAHLGACVRSAGDVNGDSYADVIIGAPLDTRSGHRFGDVLVFYGSPSGLAAQPDWMVSGTENQAAFGDSVAGAGDVNGDGFDDVLIGAPKHSGGNSWSGRAVLYLGSREGLRSAPAWEFRGPAKFDQLGASAAGIGDVNRDGFADIAIGAPGCDQHRVNPGHVFIFYGGPDGPSPSPDVTLSGESGYDLFGCALAGGDVDGDGHADLLVGAVRHQATVPEEGRVYLYRGGPRGLQPEPACTIDGGALGARCGSALACAGDVNGDGLGDFIVGTPRFGTTNKNVGRVDLFFGSATAFVPVTNAAFVPPLPVHVRRFRQVLVGALACGSVATVAGLMIARRRQRRAIHAERARIARDLHDGLGADLAHLRLLDSSTPRDPEANLSTAVQQAIQAAEQAVWTINPANDTLENLVAFLVMQADKLFAHTAVRCFTQAPPQLPAFALPPAVRQDLVLAVREALTNVLKHARASEAWLRITFAEPVLEITVEDNGIGLPENRVRRFGNGLTNLRQRMNDLGGQIEFTARPGGGTRVTLRVRLRRP